MSAYYNENDPKAAAWLRHLILEGHIAPGDVDERSICEVQPGDLDGYAQHHFFAGIGGWSLALRLAGWPDDREVCTGSCPCQPFSDAGKGLGTADPRHLWPVLFRLIRARQFPVVFGEQVASKAGREWLSGVFADLETLAYQRAAADLCAAGVGPEAEGWFVHGDQAAWEPCVLSAPHIRQRLFWVAYAGYGISRRADKQGSNAGDAGKWQQETIHAERCSRFGGMACADPARPERRAAPTGCETRPDTRPPGSRDVGGVAHPPDLRRAQHEPESRRPPMPGPADTAECGGSGRLADGKSDGRQHALEQRQQTGDTGTANGRCDGGLGNSQSDDQRRHSLPGQYGQGQPSRGPGHPGAHWMADTGCASNECGQQCGESSGADGADEEKAQQRQRGRPDSGDSCATDRLGHPERDGLRGSGGTGANLPDQSGHWSVFDILPCRDGKARRVEAGTFPLAHGVPGRVGLLRGYGNAIVPAVAAEFIQAAESARVESLMHS